MPPTLELRRAQRAAANHLCCGWPFEPAVTAAALATVSHPAWADYPGWGNGVARWAAHWQMDLAGLSVPRIEAVWVLVRALRGEYLPPRHRPPDTYRVSGRAGRRAITQAWRAARPGVVRAAPELDPDAPDTLGWRGWNVAPPGTSVPPGTLLSPSRRTPWFDAELRVEQWSQADALRGEAGIHALRVPRGWRQCNPAATEIGPCRVHGIVERFGRYILGTAGWRAEWCIIRELQAPDQMIAATLRRLYPDVKVHGPETVADRVRRNLDPAPRRRQATIAALLAANGGM